MTSGNRLLCVSRPFAALLLFSLLGLAGAAPLCEPVPGGGSLRVEGLGVAEFTVVVADSGQETFTLTGGVCVTLAGLAGVLRAESLALSRDEDWSMVGSAVAIVLPDARLEGVSLRLHGDRLVIEDATLETADAAGFAARVELNYVTGEWVAQQVRLATAIGWWDAERATLWNDGIRFEEVWFSTCDCPPADAPARIEGVWLDLTLDPLRLVVGGGVWVSALGRAALPEPLVIDPVAWDRWASQLRITPNGGVGVLWERRSVAPGVTLAGMYASGWPDGRPSVSFDLRGRSGGRAVQLRGRSDRLSVRWSEDIQLPLGWRVDVGQRLEFGRLPTQVRDSWLGLERRWLFGPSTAGSESLEGTLQAWGALTAEGPAGGETLGTRLGVGTSWLLRSGLLAGFQARLGVAVGTTVYPAVGSLQSWVSLTPGLSWQAGGWRLEVEHQARWVAGGSPFSVAVDRLDALQRTQLTLDGRLAWALDGALELQLEAVVDSGSDLRGEDGLRWLRLDPRLELRTELLAGRLSGSLQGEFAGWLQGPLLGARSVASSWRLDWAPWWFAVEAQVQGRARQPASGTLVLAVGGDHAPWSWSVAWHQDSSAEGQSDRQWRGQLEVAGDDWLAGAHVVWQPWADGPSLTSVQLHAQLPWLGDQLAWRPLLELDVVAWLRGDAAGDVWRAYGLEVAWETRLGTLEVGFAQRLEQGVSVHVGLVLPNRPVELERVVATDSFPLRAR